jgi:hypothetical protein
MGAALSLLVLMTLMIFVVRVAAVALRQTGLEETTAKFQALSAFSGTGFTTRESEAIVNYPVRRQIVTLLIVIGNLGLVTIVATLVASFVYTEGDVGAVLVQVVWLMGVLALLWFLILNKRAEQVICEVVGKILEKTTLLGKRHFHRLLQVSQGYSVCEHPITDSLVKAGEELDPAFLEGIGLVVLGVRDTEGAWTDGFSRVDHHKSGDALVIYGLDSGHDALEQKSHQLQAGNNESA